MSSSIQAISTGNRDDDRRIGRNAEQSHRSQAQRQNDREKDDGDTESMRQAIALVAMMARVFA